MALALGHHVQQVILHSKFRAFTSARVAEQTNWASPWRIIDIEERIFDNRGSCIYSGGDSTSVQIEALSIQFACSTFTRGDSTDLDKYTVESNHHT